MGEAGQVKTRGCRTRKWCDKILRRSLSTRPDNSIDNLAHTFLDNSKSIRAHSIGLVLNGLLNKHLFGPTE